MAKRPAITAEQLMNQLQADPKWVSERVTREVRRKSLEEQFEAEEAPIIADLAAAGADTTSTGDFVGKLAAPPEASRILVRHMGRGYSLAVREALIRALGVPWAREAAFEPLCAMYRIERDPHFSFLIANALSGMARFEDVSALPAIEQHASLFAE